MPGWESKRLGDVCSLDRMTYAGTDLPYVGLEDIESATGKFVGSLEPRVMNSNSFRFSDAHVLYGRLRPYLNKVIVPDFEGHCSTEIFPIRASRSLDRKYLFYWLISERTVESINQTSTGARMPRANMDAVLRLQLPLPPLPEQKRIVAILDEAFAGMESVLENTENAIQNAHAIFEDKLNSIFNSGDRGWLIKTIAEVCTLRSGTTVDKGLERASGDVPYLKVADMTLPDNSDGIVTSSRFLNKNDIKKPWLLPAGTTIFPKRGGAIMTNKKRLTKVSICADLNIMGVIPSSKIIPEYLFLFFLSVNMRVLGTGSAIPQINNYDIEPIKISFPAERKEQSEVVLKLRTLQQQISDLVDIYHAKSAALTDLKQSILQKAFAGELTAAPDRCLEAAAE